MARVSHTSTMRTPKPHPDTLCRRKPGAARPCACRTSLGRAAAPARPGLQQRDRGRLKCGMISRRDCVARSLCAASAQRLCTSNVAMHLGYGRRGAFQSPVSAVSTFAVLREAPELSSLALRRCAAADAAATGRAVLMRAASVPALACSHGPRCVGEDGCCMRHGGWRALPDQLQAGASSMRHGSLFIRLPTIRDRYTRLQSVVVMQRAAERRAFPLCASCKFVWKVPTLADDRR